MSTIGFIGAGQMASAIAIGLVNAKAFAAQSITLSDRFVDVLPAFDADLPVPVHSIAAWML